MSLKLVKFVIHFITSIQYATDIKESDEDIHLFRVELWGWVSRPLGWVSKLLRRNSGWILFFLFLFLFFFLFKQPLFQILWLTYLSLFDHSLNAVSIASSTIIRIFDQSATFDLNAAFHMSRIHFIFLFYILLSSISTCEMLRLNQTPNF